MARFQFRYQSLLDERRRVEQRAQRNLANILANQQQLRDQLLQTQNRITTGKRQLRDSLTGKIDLNAVTQFGRHNSHTLLSGQGIVNKLAALEPHIETARRQLAEAARKRKAMELLHDRDLADWKHTERRRENNLLEEAALQTTLANLSHPAREGHQL
ncbi:flagellar FliJ family protein [Mucisphaera sp.]|uniref:flagellar FliJ family protein n=1 Tax=Mucisphaera sp. TaxID=2913024 RepID=UPI003D13A3FA